MDWTLDLDQDLDLDLGPDLELDNKQCMQPPLNFSLLKPNIDLSVKV